MIVELKSSDWGICVARGIAREGGDGVGMYAVSIALSCEVNAMGCEASQLIHGWRGASALLLLRRLAKQYEKVRSALLKMHDSQGWPPPD